MRCLIVDDEASAREEMRKLLGTHAQVQVIGEAARVETALRLIELRQPDVVFLDVKLRGETGFDLLEQVPEPLPYIIFVTACDRDAAQAFRVGAVDYLLKPVEPQMLSQALLRVRQRTRPGPRVAIAHPAALRSLGLTAREAEVLFWVAHGKSNPRSPPS